MERRQPVKPAIKRLALYLAGRLLPSVRFLFPGDTGAIYLTFDDGPHPETTPRLLELLARYRARATFFCLGRNVEKYPLLYDSILADGHATGNHSFSHRSGWTTPTGKYLEDIERASAFITSKLFRPPYGRITPVQYLELKKRYEIIMWTRQFPDYREGFNPAKTGPGIIKGGDILVLHDSEKAFPGALPLLENILAICSGSFSFRPISGSRPDSTD